MLRSVAYLLFLIGFAASLAAQTPLPTYRAVAPQFAGVYDPATGTLSGGAGARLGPNVLYNNNSLTNYYSVPSAGFEWIDEGINCDKSTLWDDVQINGFDFTYCSSEPDPTQNSGSFTITFYDETIICQGPLNGANYFNNGYVCAYDITNLPLGSPNGQVQCWIVTVDLQGEFECPNTIESQVCHQGSIKADEANGKLFGWGIIPRNPNTGPWLASGGKGTDNSFIEYDPFGMFQGCFWFGGSPFASFAFRTFGRQDGLYACYPCAPDQLDILEIDAYFNIFGELCIEVLNWLPSEDYSLLASFAPNEFSALNGTVMVDYPNLAVPALPFPQGSNKLTYNGTFPSIIYVQVVCHVGPLTPFTVTAFSHCFCICQ